MAFLQNASPSPVAGYSFPCSRPCPYRLLHTFYSSRPARNYPRFWIWRSSSERQRDLNPPDQRADQEGSSPSGARMRSAISKSRSEEHTSELQSQSNIVCRLLLEKK